MQDVEDLSCSYVPLRTESYFFESVSFSRLPQIKVVSARVSAARDTWMPSHFHSCYELIYVFSGSLLLMTKDKILELQAGTLTMINPIELHRYECQSDRSSFLMVQFSEKMLLQLLGSLPVFLTRPFAGISNPNQIEMASPSDIVSDQSPFSLDASAEFNRFENTINHPSLSHSISEEDTGLLDQRDQASVWKPEFQTWTSVEPEDEEFPSSCPFENLSDQAGADFFRQRSAGKAKPDAPAARPDRILNPLALVEVYISDILDGYFSRNMLRCSAGLLALLGLLQEHGQITQSAADFHPLIPQILEYMTSSYAQDLSPYDVAQRFNISYGYLCQLLQRDIGMSFKQILDNIRLEHAMKDVLSNGLSITQISINHGFASPNSFIALFRRHYGQTPLQYRKSHVGLS